MKNFTTPTLLISGLMYLGFGIIFIINPSFLENAYIFSNHPTGLMEIRAFYGGLEIGLGLILLYSIKTDRSLQKAALCLLSSILFFTILGRVIGVFLDGIEGYYLWIALIIEIPILIASILATKSTKLEIEQTL